MRRREMAPSNLLILTRLICLSVITGRCALRNFTFIDAKPSFWLWQNEKLSFPAKERFRFEKIKLPLVCFFGPLRLCFATAFNMKLIGITGGIGMGKSACGELLRQRRLPVIDTDAIAHQIVEPGQPALVEIKNAFGEEMIGTDGRLRRDQLAAQVFAQTEARQKLEDILHPRIRSIWQSEAEQWQKAGQGIGFVIIPLLFETQAAAHFFATICLACSEKSQQERLHARGWSAPQIQQRLAAQWPTEKKMMLADFVIWTETPLAVHAAQLDRLLAHQLS